jgi:serine-type D-Ala-D-Ala carboxypeptidase (penicillin-binding protein 5/6)
VTEILQVGRARRRTTAPGHLFALTGLGLLAATVTLLVFMAPRAAGPTSVNFHSALGAATATAAPRPRSSAAGWRPTPAPASERVEVRLKLRLSSGMLFDVDTGHVLWERNPDRILPIASLTKMMTALLVVAHAKPTDRVLITPQAIHFSGSGVGLLPLGKRVQLLTLLYGLMLPSGNDAAIALAQRVAATEKRFIAMMNARAGTMWLRCSHFATASGIVDQGNASCVTDLAVLAHAVLKQPLLARIVGSRSAILPFPIKGRKLYLYNNNPLLLSGYPGADGVKTGYTVASGPCLVATARRGRTWLGVVLLNSGNTTDQAEKLLDAGFAKLRGRRTPA